MPTINKLPKKPKSTEHADTDMRELRRKAYDDVRWRKLRTHYMQQHPLCEECLKHGKVNAGTLANPLQVHHLKSPFIKGTINWQMFLDEDNLETICGECHGKLHAEEKGYVSPADVLKALEALFEEVEDED